MSSLSERRGASPIVRAKEDPYAAHPERYPAPSTMLAHTRSVHVWDDWSIAKPREECTPFTFELATNPSPDGIKGQEKFAKALGILTRKQARAAEKRAKLALKAAA